MRIEEPLLHILACPEDKGPLFYVESESILYNPRLKRSYPVVDGIPVMLIQEASAVSDQEHARIQQVIESHGIKPTFSR